MIIAQDGSGPATKIEDGLDKGYLDGVILSIKSRAPETLPLTVANLISKHPTSDIFLDVHFYASQMAMTKAGRIPDYQLFDAGLTRKDFSSIKNINNFARRIIDYQKSLGLTNIILPSLTLNNFNDGNSLVSLQLYQAGLDYIKEIDIPTTPIKAYLALSFQESALLDDENLSQYLDEITLFENVTGFYVVTERVSGDSPQWGDSRTLSKLMYIVNALSKSYKVVCGFTDFPGMLLLASGANHVASGWHQTLRSYTSKYFQGGGWGSHDVFRYPSKQLLTQLLSSPDLKRIIEKGFASEYVDSEYGNGLSDPNNLQFSPHDKAMLQWKVFHDLGLEIIKSADPLVKIEKLIGEAEDRLSKLRVKGVVLDRSSVSHYSVWKKAITTFKNGVL